MHILRGAVCSNREVGCIGMRDLIPQVVDCTNGEFMICKVPGVDIINVALFIPSLLVVSVGR